MIPSAYRSVLRQLRQISREELRFIEPLDANRWGRGGFVANQSQTDALTGILPPSASWTPGLYQLLQNCHDYQTSGPADLTRELKKFARTAFREACPTSPTVTTNQIQRDQPQQLTALLDNSFQALRILQSQIDLNNRSSICTTEGVQVEASSVYVGGTANAHVFAYRVRVQNVGEDCVQLLGRHWIIDDSAGDTVEVPKGSPHVVGHSPVLWPGQCFEYHSGTPLTGKKGMMRGSFQMVRRKDNEEDTHFDAYVSPLPLRA